MSDPDLRDTAPLRALAGRPATVILVVALLTFAFVAFAARLVSTRRISPPGGQAIAEESCE